MRLLTRILQVTVALALVSAVTLWFGARRGDRGFIVEEVTIARPAATVFRWISSDELARRWISDVVELRKGDTSGAGQGAGNFKLVQMVSGHRVDLNLRVAHVVPNQELTLLVSSGEPATGGFSGDANFKLIAGDDYTRLVFTSHTQFVRLGDRIFEPVLTFATQRKIRGDLAKLKLLMEAEQEKHVTPHATSLGR
jgi:uncharacterized protein YndB with AHSA1/START domain